MRNRLRAATVGLLAGLALWGHTGVDGQETGLPGPEHVELLGVSYEVPPPWRGRRIELSVDPSALVRLPARFTRERGIYVTAGAKDAFAAMASAALKAGVHLEVESGFRSYGYQKQVLERVMADGVSFDVAVRWIAPPGYSEHITGRAVDFIPSDLSFGRTAAYAWLRAHAGAFCFSESYPQTRAEGFSWEPWHWRHEDCGTHP